MPLKIQRGQSPLQNIGEDVPVTVVPDNQMPQYGAEVPARSTNQALESILAAIKTHQQPVTIPFPGGAPTQRRREAEEATRQFDVGHEFSREKFDWQKQMDETRLALQRAAAAGMHAARQ